MKEVVLTLAFVEGLQAVEVFVRGELVESKLDDWPSAWLLSARRVPKQTQELV